MQQPQSDAEVDWVESESSLIKRFGYRHHQSKLIVTFVKPEGTTWEYDNVPVETFEAMKTAESAGKFFHANIKPIFTGSKVS